MIKIPRPQRNLGNVLEKTNETSKKTFKRAKKALLITLVFIFVLLFWLGWQFYGFSSKIIARNTEGSAPALVKGLALLDEIKPRDLKGEGDGRVNVLLLGVGGERHEGPYLTDSILIVSVDPVNLSVAILSIPRDLLVPVTGFGYVKMNSIYTLGENNKTLTSGGPALLKKTLGQLFDIPIHYYALIDFNGFIKAIDAIGGINIEVPEDIYDPFYPDGYGGYDQFYIKKGFYKMDGETALKYARSRETTSDFDRSRRQQAIMVAFKEKLMNFSTFLSFKRLNEMMNILSDHIKTDIQLWEIERLIEIAKKIDTSNIQTKVLDDGPEGFLYGDSVEGMYVLRPAGGSFLRIKQFVHQFFKDIYLSEEEALIEVQNGTAREGLAAITSNELTALGYKVVKFGNADRHDYETTIIYDFSGGRKPFTVEYLRERFKAKLITQEDPTNLVDIKIIIGADYDSYY